MIPLLEGWPIKAKEVPSPHEVRLAPLDTNPVFQSLGGKNKVVVCVLVVYVWRMNCACYI